MIDFKTYDEAHPEVYRAFRHYAMQAYLKGMKRYSANGIFERIRWEMIIQKGNENFKLNNNYRPDYARKLMELHPEFKGFFETRKLKATRTK